MRSLLLSVMTAILLHAGAAWAGPLEDGAAANQRGDYVEAVKQYRLAAAQGDADAQYLLGSKYEYGQGVAQDYAEAIKWYRLSAAQGMRWGQSGLGRMYEFGEGVAQDYTEAIRWYRLAAAQGQPLAQYVLGNMYESGKGVAQDYAEAIKWYRLAAAQGDGLGQSGLGRMYELGRGVAQNYGEAVKWYRLAAAQGNALGQSGLGRMYELGRGVAQNYGEAVKDYNTGTWQIPSIDTAPIQPPPPPDPYSPDIGWQTRQPALLCDSYFRVKDGEKAALSGDHKWLAETGCIIASGGLRLVLLDTPDYKVSDAWRARIYSLDGGSRDVYLRSVDAVNFAKAGTYKTEAEATTALTEMAYRYKREYSNLQEELGHRLVSGPDGVKLLIGPASSAELYLFCSAAESPKARGDRKFPCEEPRTK